MDDPTIIRFLFFVTSFCLFACWEWMAPRKALTQNKAVRWSNNLALIALNSALLSFAMPLLAFQAALIASSHGWGLFNLIALPWWFEILLTVILLDMTIYIQHLVFHRIPILWRFHRMHHADQDIDLTTGSRFHPVEIILSLWIKIVCVMLLGAPAVAVVIFEVVLNVSAMFNHSNAAMPLKLDRLLRRVIVTPDMHRVHHSVLIKETHSNFGFFLSVWDQLFKTYRAQPKQGHDHCVIGIERFREPKEQYLSKMLTQPFR